MSQFQQEFITTVIKQYGLDLDGDRINEIVATWFQEYDPNWIMKAIVESLYRGRYKVKSVNNILKDWQRRGNPLYQFTSDYEQEILQSLPAMLALPTTTTAPAPLDRKLAVITSPTIDRHKLMSEEQKIAQHPDGLMLPANPSSSKAGETEKLATPQLKHLDPEAPQPEVESSAPLLPLQQLPVENRQNVNNIKIDRRIVPLPEKSYLFNTLKSIVETSIGHRHKEEIQTSGQL
ncbi:MAG: hypothetical protein RLZZ135_2394 [Cyanobacteriota bacterium]|jgi:hypothetical protein